jgi:crotonobetainyl-CoA hydratase
LLTGRRLSAADAATWGLVNRVVPAHELSAAAAELAVSICASAPLAVAAVLEIMRETEGVDVRSGFEILRSARLPAYRAMVDSADAREGPRAFAERRRPVWLGR